MADYGYDVADFCGVDPLFGDLAAFDALVADAHALGLKVIIDWVPNHTSIEHPWFAASRRSKDDPRRDWYVWRDPAPDGGPPNNWVESLTMGPAWTLDEATGQYYLHCFLPEQPDLNWANDQVVDAMGDTLRFWLDRGVDGFRMDVVHLIGKDPALPDEPPELAGLPHVVLNDRPETHDHLRGIRRLLDGYPGDRVAVGEVYLLDTDLVAEHYGDDDELHLCFNFPPLYAPWEADAWRRQIARTAAAFDPRGAWPTWVLSNHDNPRHRTRYGGSEARARAAAVLLLTLRGTPFVYAGEELGLLDAEVPEDHRHDPAGRDGCRAPIPWDATATHGWTDDEPWLPWPPETDRRNVATERADDGSILHLYRDLLALRRATRALQLGDLHLLDGPEGVLVYRRHLEGDATDGGADHVVVAVNFTDAPVAVDVTGEVLLSTHGTSGAAAGLELAGDEAVILRASR
jgi:alpha-glucosidase